MPKYSLEDNTKIVLKAEVVRMWDVIHVTQDMLRGRLQGT
jgi:hypothetical protein